MSAHAFRRRFLGFATSAALIGSNIPFVRAQQSEVTCLPGFEWASNSLGQNPCLIGAFVLSVCEGPSDVTPLNISAGITQYNSLNTDFVDHCSCSGVWYSLISACALCQGGSTAPYQSYIANCSANFISVGSFSPGVPTGTALPAWTLMNVSASTKFDVLQAQQIGDKPELLAGAQGTGQTTARGATSSRTAGSPVPTGGASNNGSNSSSSSKGSNTGAIAGGIIAALAVLGIIGAGVAYYLRRKRLNARNNYGSGVIGGDFGGAGSMSQTGMGGSAALGGGSSAMYHAVSDTHAPLAPSVVNSGAGGGYDAYSVAPAQSHIGGSGGGSSNMKLYDPSDPSTFPQTPSNMSSHYGDTASLNPTLVNPASPPPQLPTGGYTGGYAQQGGAVASKPGKGAYAGYPEI